MEHWTSKVNKDWRSARTETAFLPFFLFVSSHMPAGITNLKYSTRQSRLFNRHLLLYHGHAVHTRLFKQECAYLAVVWEDIFKIFLRLVSKKRFFFTTRSVVLDVKTCDLAVGEPIAEKSTATARSN